jgi:hypothetical protein
VRKLLAAVAVIVVLLVIADRVAVVIVETRIGDTIQSQQALTSRPSVKISGFPFLTQVARHSFDKVTFDASTVTVSGEDPVVIESVTATLRHVHASSDYSHGTVQSATGSGVISYASLSKQVGSPVGWAGTGSDGRGRLQASATVTVLGQPITASASAQLVLTGPSTIGFSDVQLAGVGVPQLAVATLEAVFKKSLTISGLPVGLSVSDVSANPRGVELSLTGRDLVLK